MKIVRIVVTVACLLAAQGIFARPVAVTAVFTGIGPGVLLDGTAAGTLYGVGDLSNGVLTLYGSLRTEFDDNGTLSVWTSDIETMIDFAVPSGSWETTNCVDVSGPAFCAISPPSSGAWDSVSGTPFNFVTVENGTAVTWEVTDVSTPVPTMSFYGTVFTILGLLVLAARRLRLRRIY